MPIKCKTFVLKALFVAVLLVQSVNVVAEPATPVIGKHVIQIGGQTINYLAETGRVAIRDAETGEPHGFMFYIAYMKSEGKTPRPVTFVWNGGPGANSVLLHFEIAGPKRLEDDTLIDNPETWLTDTDLVFVDPVGTGFSRPAKPEYADEFYGTLGDVASVTEFVRSWLILHEAEDRPVILAGESWGAGRAGNVGYELLLRNIPVRALVLISGGAGLSQSVGSRELSQALQVVDRTATARFHERLGQKQGVAEADFTQQAEVWAREIYTPALQRRDQLTGAEKDNLIAQLSGFTGMPIGLVSRETLAINPRAYREGLLDDPGLVLDIFDMRLIKDADPSENVSRRLNRQHLIMNYLRGELGYRTAMPYVGVEDLEQGYAPGGEYPQAVGNRWDYATAKVSPEDREAAYQAAMESGSGPPQLGPRLPSAAEAVVLNPDLKVLVAAGLYDSLNSCAGNEELAQNIDDQLKQAYRFICYAGGHMMYRDPQSRIALSDDLRTLAREVRQ